MKQVLELNVPSSVLLIENLPSFQFFPLKENIDLSPLIKLSQNISEEDEEKYKLAILDWMQENLETKLSYKKYLIKYEDNSEDVIETFKISTSEKNPISFNYYLIIKKLKGLDFKEDYNQIDLDDYKYIELEKAENEFEFSINKEKEFSKLEIYISPNLERLNLEESQIPEPETKSNKWIYFWIIIGILIIVFFIVYIFLQEWYKKKYENHLFKDRNHLFNLLIFIKNSKDKNMTNKEIFSVLKKTGWNSEQINYALRKFEGKRTGMFEIPIDKFLIKSQIKKAEKKQTNLKSPQPRIKNNFSKFNRYTKT